MTRTILPLVLAVVCGAASAASGELDLSAMMQPLPASAVMREEGYFVWGGSLVKGEDGLYHLFYSRWPKETYFPGWVTHSEIAHATAPSPAGPWTHRGVSLPKRGAEFWDGLCTHNPCIRKFDGKYYLYYTGNTGDGKAMKKLNWTHRNNQRIGVAVADSPFGPWRRFDKPVIDVSADKSAPDSLMMSNPAITRRPDGLYELIYKGVGQKRKLPFGGPVVHLAALSKSPVGPFVKDLKPIFTDGKATFPAEDPCLFTLGGKVYAAVKDMNGHFTSHKGRSLVLFEKGGDGAWKPARHAFITGTKLRYASGKVQNLRYLERPQLYCEDGRPVALCCAVGTLDMKETFNVQIPLAPRSEAAPEQAQTLILEAESFDDWGGWVNDTQFMDQMGSPYLLAHGLGQPVTDATKSFTVKGGTYRVFVRTMNWTARWSEAAAGLFQVLVDGKHVGGEDGAAFGTGAAEWSWRKGGVVTLAAGRHVIALRDLSGFDGRVDAICLSTDENPPELQNRPRRASSAESHVSAGTFDFCVVGGGIAGISAAVSAARLGLTVALVHNRPVLGGNNSSEVRVHLGAWQNVPPYPRLGDVLAEYGPRKGGNARDAATYEDGRKLAIVKAEKNITLFLNEHVNGVEMRDAGRIAAVRAVNTRTGCATRIAAALFADCTGDGNLGYLAGADYRMGREAKSETGEPGAPEKADALTMGASVQWYAHDAAADAPFPVQPWMLTSINEANCSPHLRGDWWWEAGLGRDQIAEAEYIRDYGLLVAYSNWAFVKNGYSRKDAFADKELKWVAYNAGRRESRRLLGDFILDQNHLRKKDFQKDGTCATTWTIDLHLPKTAAESKFAGEPYQSNSLNERVWPYPIPYRCLYSRNVSNLFMAGRDISVTHIALGTTRLMRTHGMQGEVVGMAASVCRKHGCLPRDVYAAHFGDLKSLMEKGVGDGGRHPRQTYNCGGSRDKTLMKKYAAATEGRIR